MSRCVVLSIGAVALRDSGPRRPVAVRLPEESSDRIPGAGPNPGAGAPPFRQRPQSLVAEPHVRRGRTKPPIASAKVLFFPSDLQKAGDKLVAAGCFSDFRCRCRYCRRCCCRCRCCCRSRRRSDCSGSFDYLRCSGHSVRSVRSDRSCRSGCFGRFVPVGPLLRVSACPGRGVPGHARSERLSNEFPMSKGIPVAVGAGRGESQNRSCPTAARCGGLGRSGRTGGRSSIRPSRVA